MTTAAEARLLGPAAAEQRAEIKRLLETKRYAKEWRDRFFDDVRAEGDLTAVRATGVLNFLRQQPDLGATTIHATAEQLDRFNTLVRERIAPGPWVKMIRARIDAGTLAYDQADLHLADLERMPRRTFVAPPAGASVDASKAPDGYFALTGTDGRVRCYRVHTSRAGGRVVEQFTDDTSQRRRRVKETWKSNEVLTAVSADVATAARLFAETRKHCSDCNQPLHDKAQPGYPHGYGPDCWAEIQTAVARRDQLAEDPGKDGDPLTPDEQKETTDAQP